MIGIIVTGHINFASGIKSAVTAIVGEQQDVEYVDFIEGTSREDLEELLLAAYDKVDQGHGVLFCTDVPSGTPFQVSAQICTDRKPTAALTGSNISLVTEAVMERTEFSDVGQLAAHVTEVGKSAIQSISF
uniref:PTS sugar transporter subunit IIA n=1 Tax=Thaumasiovibrio occultus TaxID=1891184 RepID=UPI000B3602DD|nr:PTS sugar transporter subunit IIA [Thaumasiovibrio occultus]